MGNLSVLQAAKHYLMQLVLSDGIMDDGFGEGRVTFSDAMSRANKPTHTLNHSIIVIKKFILNKNISINMNREGATIILYNMDGAGSHPLPPEVYRDRSPYNSGGDLVTFCARILELCDEWEDKHTVHLVDKAFWDA